MHAECRLGVGTDTDRVLSERRRGSWRIAIHNAAQSARRARYLRSQGTKEDKKLPLSLAAQSSSRVNYELDRGMQPSDTDDTALAILFAFVVVFVTSLIIYMATS